MTISPTTSKPTNFTLGGAQFFGTSTSEASRLFKVEASAAPVNPLPIALQLGAAGHRAAVDLSVDEAEALGACIAEAVRRRRNAELKALTAERQQVRWAKRSKMVVK